METTAAIIVAAGRGARFGGDKLSQPLRGRPVLHWTLAAFEACSAIDTITLVVADPALQAAGAWISAAGFSKVETVCPGGAERQESVLCGLRATRPAAWVAVHDGARPLVTPALIEQCVEAARCHGAAAPALPLADTLKRLDDEGRIAQTIDRRAFVAIQTPQVFRWELLLEAHEAAARDSFTGTDDASLVERLGYPVWPVPGKPRNLKITTPADLALADALLAASRAGDTRAASDTRAQSGHQVITPSGHHPHRVGFGYDVHRLVPGRPLVLGGVTIPHSAGLLGHSDADVLCHAIGDALLGAAGLGDLGHHFPDTDPRWKDASSLDLLRRITVLVREAGWAPWHVDATLLAEAPKIAPHVAAMAEGIASALGVSPAAVNLKATTCEGLGFVGHEEGMAAQAVVTVAPAAGG
jgi:2-C-methyl-D-erythritol 4-phosphate cytidylyltransferase/2-C-methyl-D-erythritol 2,4-cyclodiphosphate synthase